MPQLNRRARQCHSYGHCNSARSCNAPKKPAAKGADRSLEPLRSRVDEVGEVQSVRQVPWIGEVKLQVTRLSCSRDRARSVELYDGELLMTVMRYP